MKLIELKNYTENNFDKAIIERMSKDSESNLNNYISSVICDLLQHIPMEDTFKINAKNNINNYDEKCIGELCAYLSLIPYVQLNLKENKDGYVITSTFIEMLISYIVGYITREEFIKSFLKIKETLKMSDTLYNGFITYFAFKKEEIVSGINERLK